MFSELPKLFDRAFFISYFLPSSMIFSIIFAILSIFNRIPIRFQEFVANKSTFGAAISIVIMWLISILLMALNRPMIRFLEGYGRHNPLSIFQAKKNKQFQDRIFPLLSLRDKVIEARRANSNEPLQRKNFAGLLHDAINTFPERVENVLPTRLGNIMRAYERYSDIVYGIEAIVLWPRIMMVIPDVARDRVREGRVLFDFALNTLFAGLLTIFLYAVMVALDVRPLIAGFYIPSPIIPALGIVLSLFGWWQLPGAARERGEQTKSIFDLYRRDLALSFGLELPPTYSAERRMWELVSRRLMFNVAEDVSSLDEFRYSVDKTRTDGK
jgi:hypothetical protein